jgi:aspartyl-tRNA(Asn)/glutamyl-tRNA(Gln) amidotransferase subunit C
VAFTPEDVRKCAQLARLALSEEEIVIQSRHIAELLERFKTLQQLDLDGIEPTSHCLAVSNVFREDHPEDPLPREQALANGPEVRDGCFVVPRILE